MSDSSRTLIYIPILHTGIDMGQAAPLLADAAQTTLGANAWRRRALDIEHMWDGIEAAIPRLGLDLKSLHIYQDGLPVCGHELEIVDDLAKAGSRNHRLLQTLSREGATIVGTEAPELLVEEYELAWRLLNAASADGQRTDVENRLASDMLQRRDRFIAHRIDETLPAGGTGMLFVGALHRVAPLLPPDLAVSYPLGSPAI
ncbi:MULTISPECIES: hypothetical protein [Burkholderia]|uniref:Uncharacterized protein n=1 Tax=Burkholderia savannae TaxID=1637837 RepID=A0ABR5T7J1_9BURK|nr:MULTISPECIES: hypothetical protein [Burkholderia]AOJ71125.1 hypothetical protein WS78_19795 [Burkholderia savannae]AOJ84254.1 hypothetical protein WS86_27240 [Burkholderia savannae]AOK49520.1 hypothetical protein WT60_21610 [Burkholderia sp. MSMB617WGS]KGS08462.1 hypothetical protein X946_441 [Burkholderia sp. ABCPW 111]KVG48807.1 hypothetical protein WS77_03550 [Burkholderia sp. MSMB0265]